MAEHVSDDMLWKIAICGDAAQAREILAHRKRLPGNAFVAAPSFSHRSSQT